MDPKYEAIIDALCTDPKHWNMSRSAVKAKYPAFLFPGTASYMAVASGGKPWWWSKGDPDKKNN
jgi:hypothetical protein